MTEPRATRTTPGPAARQSLWTGASRASCRYADWEAPHAVTQAGPRDLWNKITAAHPWWIHAGRPGVERLGLTTTPEGQHREWPDDRRTHGRCGSTRNRVPLPIRQWRCGFPRADLYRRDIVGGPSHPREAAVPDRSWSIDSIAHALPHPVTRQKFLSQVNLTPVAELQAVIDRWIAFVERWEAEKPRIDAIARYARDHGGELPPDFDDDGSGEEWLTQWRSRMRGRNSDAA